MSTAQEAPFSVLLVEDDERTIRSAAAPASIPGATILTFAFWDVDGNMSARATAGARASTSTGFRISSVPGRLEERK